MLVIDSHGQMVYLEKICQPRKEIFVLTRRGEPLAAIVPVEDLKRLQDLEDIEDARQARIESEERISWNDLKAELSL